MANDYYTNKLKNPNFFEWVAVSGGSWTVDNAIKGGEDVNKETLYIGRGLFGGDVVPGKVVKSHAVCYVPWGSKENSLTNYQVLRTLNSAQVSWVEASKGAVPSGAVQGGILSDGKPLYIGRTNHGGSLVVGKIHPDHKVLYIPFGGKEYGYDNYEALCLKTVTF